MGKKSNSDSYRGKVLVINDEPGARDHINRWMAETGYHCTFVNSAFEADALLGHEYFDTIVYSHEFMPDHTSRQFPPRSK